MPKIKDFKKPLPPEPTDSDLRFSALYLTKEGTFDWERMRPSSREKFIEAAAATPDIMEKLGFAVQREAVEEIELPSLTEANVREALDLLSKANALAFRVIVPRVAKHPLLRDKSGKPLPMQLDPDIALKAFTLTDAQHAELDPRALRLSKKHAPEWLTKNLDLYMLCTMYLKFTADNAVAAMTAQVRRDVASIQQAAGVQPPSRPLDSDAPKPGNGRASNVPEEFGTAFAKPVEGQPLEPGSTAAIEP